MSQKNALISVYDKTGIVEFAGGLHKLGWMIYSSGGTARQLRDSGLPVIDTAAYIGTAVAKQVARLLFSLEGDDKLELSPAQFTAIVMAFGEPIMNHRVATLWPHIHGGILRRDNVDSDIAQLEAMCGVPFDLVCVDMYPLEAAIADPNATVESVVELTDIGGPTLLRSAAKAGRIVICDASDRPTILEALKAHGDLPAIDRHALAAKTETTVAKYCLASGRFHSLGQFEGFIGELAAGCKYGENAWQIPARHYTFGTDDPLGLEKFQLITGTAPSYNNRCDIDRLLQTITHIAATFQVNRGLVPKIAVGVKHGNACGGSIEEIEVNGAAVGADTKQILINTVMGDPRAIHGGWIMTNFPIGEAEAQVLKLHGIDPEVSKRRLLDGIVAPAFTDEAVKILKRAKDKCRFMANPALADLTADSLDTSLRFRHVRNGFLTQPNYTYIFDLRHAQLEVIGQPSEQELNDALLGIAINHTSNSNTITIVRQGMLIGNGCGRQDRVGAAELAIKIAHDSGHITAGAVAISDSFFPYDDGPIRLINAGVRTILTTSGSVHDDQVKQTIANAGVNLMWIPDTVGRGFFGH